MMQINPSMQQQNKNVVKKSELTFKWAIILSCYNIWKKLHNMYLV